MKSCVIYYFSGTGNTWWVATRIAEMLQESKIQVSCYSIETLMIEDVLTHVSEADHIILGFPVYGSTAPRPMMDFIHTFPLSNGQQTISIFATQAMASGDTAWTIGQRFEQKAYTVQQTRHFRMMNNLHLPQFKFYPPKNDQRLDRLLAKTLPRVAGFVREIVAEKKHLTGNNPLGHFLGGLQRRHIDTVIAKASHEFRISRKRCILCGKCQRICPTGNIMQRQNDLFFSDGCALCLRCYSQCPTAAILLGEGSEDVNKYPRYKGPGNGFNVEVLIK
ncbi:MAG: 4Fe-4S binding protein [Acetobacterium woodii]|nr:4Fe-4S binding protein [Acetobacterium woodii]